MADNIRTRILGEYPRLEGSSTYAITNKGESCGFEEIPKERSYQVEGKDEDVSATYLWEKSEGGATVSTYPDGLGEPFADAWMRCSIGDSVKMGAQVIAIADGCGFGKTAAMAAKNACKGACEEIDRIFRNPGSIATVGELEDAFMRRIVPSAQNAVCPPGSNDPHGTTTLLVGALHDLYKTSSDVHAKAFTFLSVGDCMCFLVSDIGEVEELSPNIRGDLTNASKSGGRIGSTSTDETIVGSSDLTNLFVKSVYVPNGYTLFLCSDGVHDCFDPQHLGFSVFDAMHYVEKAPSQLAPPGMYSYDDYGTFQDMSWREASNNHATLTTNLKSAFRCKELQKRLFQVDANIKPYLMATLACKEVFEITATTRKWMDENPTEKPPLDYKNFPGKLDHATAFVLDNRWIKTNTHGPCRAYKVRVAKHMSIAFLLLCAIFAAALLL